MAKGDAGFGSKPKALEITAVGFKSRIHVGGQPYTSLNLDRDRGFSLDLDLDRGLLWVRRATAEWDFETLVPIANIDYMNTPKVKPVAKEAVA